jgi:predicted nuclease of predicted toxin-antitoxin system
VKLLLDQNLSRHLLRELEPVFPGSSHVQLLQMESVQDAEIWSYAHANAYAIVTKDADFVELSALRGPLPKVIWLNLGNVPNSVLKVRLLGQRETIRDFLANTSDGVLAIE